MDNAIEIGGEEDGEELVRQCSPTHEKANSNELPRQIKCSLLQHCTFTQEKLVPLLMSRGHAVEVETFEVQVQTLCGGSFNVKMDMQDRTGKTLKGSIEVLEGTPISQQQLFIIRGDRNDDISEAPLQNQDVLAGPCTVCLCVRSHKSILSQLFQRLSGQIDQQSFNKLRQSLRELKSDGPSEGVPMQLEVIKRMVQYAGRDTVKRILLEIRTEQG